MPDHGHPITFGYFLVPDASSPLLDVARDVEARGLDCIAVQDHPYQRRFVDVWVLLSMIAAQTSRVRLFPDVANLALRPPAVLAKTAASLDVLSAGRAELGLGAGGFWDAIEAYGGERRSPSEALQTLEEAIAVIRAVWSGERNLRVDGRHYRLAGAHSGPVPAHPMGIWLGVHGPRAIRLTARLADGWVPSLRGELMPVLEAAGRLDAAAVDAGRDPGEIRRVLNISGEITSGPTRGPLRGPLGQWVDELTDLAVGYGFDTFVLGGDTDLMARFAAEVAPAVRDRVDEERS